ISWHGLDTLYVHVANQSPTELEGIALQGSAAKMRDSVESILHLVQEGRTADEIAGRVSIDCYGFSFTALDEGLQRFRAPASLGTSIKRTCARVQVVTDPPDASVTISKHELGTVPQAGAAYWVNPAPATEIRVWAGAYRSSKAVDLQAGKFVDARFFLPRDTLVWPVTRTATQIATDLHLFDRFTPTTPRPVQ